MQCFYSSLNKLVLVESKYKKIRTPSISGVFVIAEISLGKGITRETKEE